MGGAELDSSTVSARTTVCAATSTNEAGIGLSLLQIGADLMGKLLLLYGVIIPCCFCVTTA